MVDKIRDVKYCGVRKEVVLSAEPKLNEENIRHFLTFISERYKVHIRKDIIKKQQPWTKNKILATYRFTNVRREHDYQSKQLISAVSTNTGLTLEDKIANTFMFRAWNNCDTFSFFGFPRPAWQIFSKRLKEKVRPRYTEEANMNPERKWWSSAYNQGGTKAAWKFPEGDGYQKAYKESDAMHFPDWEKDIPLRPFHIGPWLDSQEIIYRILGAKDQQEVFNAIKSVRGFSDFLAYQVFVDLTYIPEFPFSENEFVVAGPGCKKGLLYLFEDFDGLSPEEAIFWLRNNYNSLVNDVLAKYHIDTSKHAPSKFMADIYNPADRYMSVMSLENCLCEISKYIRAVTKTGGPRNRYRPIK